MKWRYTNIQHPPRIAMGLTPNEYCVLDVIYQSQTHPRYNVDGWARVGCHKIASFLGFSSGAVHAMLGRFEKWGFLEFNETRELKRTLPNWYDVAYIENVDSEEGVQILNGVQKVNRGGSKSEQVGVQKLNGKRSKIEPITNKYKFKSKIVREDAPTFSPDEMKDWEEQLSLNASEEKRKKVAAKKEKEIFAGVISKRHIQLLTNLKPENAAKYAALNDEKRGIVIDWLNYRTSVIRRGYKSEAGVMKVVNIMSDHSTEEAKKIFWYSVENEYRGLFPDSLKKQTAKLAPINSKIIDNSKYAQYEN